jgi:hypothetical protein
MRDMGRYDLWLPDEFVDGSDLNLAEQSAMLAAGVPPAAAAMLCAELRNVVVPAYDRVDGRTGKQLQRLFALADALEDVARSAE